VDEARAARLLREFDALAIAHQDGEASLVQEADRERLSVRTAEAHVQGRTFRLQGGRTAGRNEASHECCSSESFHEHLRREGSRAGWSRVRARRGEVSGDSRGQCAQSGAGAYSIARTFG